MDAAHPRVVDPGRNPVTSVDGVGGHDSPATIISAPGVPRHCVNINAIVGRRGLDNLTQRGISVVSAQDGGACLLTRPCTFGQWGAGESHDAVQGHASVVRELVRRRAGTDPRLDLLGTERVQDVLPGALLRGRAEASAGPMSKMTVYDAPRGSARCGGDQTLRAAPRARTRLG